LTPFWDALLYIKSAFVGVALVTLGAQLASVERGGARYPVSLAVGLRLLGGPLVGIALIYLLGLHGTLAQVLFISTATPTAVNTMLLCAEFDNHPTFVAKSVFYSMLLSPITVTLVIFCARSGSIPVFSQ
jgi:predicted permease